MYFSNFIADDEDVLVAVNGGDCMEAFVQQEKGFILDEIQTAVVN